MAFTDQVRISGTAGRGGDGVVRWLHLKGKEKGGPSGGDGGNGGNVVLVGVRDLGALAKFRFEKKFKAENGKPGEGDNRYGANGADCELLVPVGTVAVLDDGREYEVITEGERITLFKGGLGGKGNVRFKGATNQNPEQQTDGKPGEKGDITLSLKIIADAGLIGYPNAGKSSLLNALTRAKSKVGAYPFTTLDPHLGDFYGYILADIPGLIEGASSGRGLGSKFLKHTERTGFLIHVISSEQEDPAAAYTAIRAELMASNQMLADKDELVVLSKVDLLLPEEREAHKEALQKVSGKEVFLVSIEEPDLLKNFSDLLAKRFAERQKAKEAASA